MVPFKCDVHNWMNAWVGVLDHPFYAVSGSGGAFDIRRTAAWHLHASKRGTRSSARRRRWSRSAPRKRRRCPSRSSYSPRSQAMRLHLYAVLVALSTAVLIFAGGLVTSTGSGLSVPDWPTTYGWFMFTFPLEKMVGGIRFEHTHRLIASTVGFLILVLAVWLRLAEPRQWVRRLGYVALGAVDHAGHPRRHHCAVVPSGSDLDCSREPGATRLLSDDRDRVDDVSWMEARVRGTRTCTRRSDPSADCDGDDGPRVCADSGRRDHETHGCGAGNTGLPAGVRASHSA